MAKKPSPRDPMNRPQIPPGTHPVETDSVLIATPAIYELSEALNGWLESGVPGAMVTGLPRFGKTRAIKYLMKELEAKGEGDTALDVLWESMAPVTKNQFCRHWLLCLGHPKAHKGSGADKWERLKCYMVWRMRQAAPRRLIIFIDEAQEMSRQEFQWLRDLYNVLERGGGMPLFVLVGQPDLAGKRDGFRTDHQQIIGRFMSMEFELFGPEGEKDLEACLRGFDEASEYPTGSEWSYSQYFFPGGYAAGWRLASEAGKLWKAFFDVHAEEHSASKMALPMNCVIGAIRIALMVYTDTSDSFSGLTLAQWKDAVCRTGYVGAGLYLTPPKEIDSDD